MQWGESTQLLNGLLTRVKSIHRGQRTLLHRRSELKLVLFQIFDHLIGVGKLDLFRLISLLRGLLFRNSLFIQSFFTFLVNFSLLSEPLPVKVIHLVYGDSLVLGELLIEPNLAFWKLLRFVPIKQKFSIALNE